MKTQIGDKFLRPPKKIYFTSLSSAALWQRLAEVCEQGFGSKISSSEDSQAVAKGRAKEKFKNEIICINFGSSFSIGKIKKIVK